MIPKFTIGKERLHITENILSNGHWLVTRYAAQSPVAPKALKPLLSAINGTYYDGLVNGVSVPTTPDMAQVIPKRDGYLPLLEQSQGVEFRADTDEVLAYKFQPQCGSFTIGVATKYVPMLRLGFAHARDALSPIIVLDSRDLNGELLAIVMPMRLKKAGE